MHAAHAMAQAIANARLVLLPIAVVLALFWRVALRMLFAITVVAAVVGAVVLLHAL